jgi:hypothetical protein
MNEVLQDTTTKWKIDSDSKPNVREPMLLSVATTMEETRLCANVTT